MTLPAIFRNPSRRLNERPRLVRVLYLTVFVLFTSYGGYHAARFASITTDENTYIDSPEGVLITKVDKGGASDRAGLKPGDVIAEVDGKAVRTTRDAMVYILNGSEGKTLDYTIVRGSTRRVVTVTLAVFGFSLYALSIMLTGVLFLVLGAFVILRRPTYPVARLLGWATLMTGTFTMVMFQYSPAYYSSAIDRLNGPMMVVAYVLAFSSMYHLFFRFPADRFAAPLPRWIFGIIYGLPWLLFLLVALNLLPQKLFMLVLPPALMIATVELLLRFKLRIPKNPHYADQALLLRIAGIIALGFAALYPFLQPASVWQGVFLLQVTVPILFFIAIVQHRLFDLYVVVRRTSKYRAAVLGLNAATAGLFVWSVIAMSTAEWRVPIPTISGTAFQFVNLASFPTDERAAIKARLIVVVALAIAWVFWKLRGRVRTVVDAKFYRGEYDYRRALTAFSKLSIRFADPVALAQAIVADLTSIMHLSGAAVIRRAAGNFVVDASRNLSLVAGSTDMLSSGSAWLAALEQRGSAEAIDNLAAGPVFAGTGVEFASPVFVDGRLEAVILLGEKLSGTNFSKDDVELLANLSINAADAIVTMTFYEGTKEQERMRRELEIARRIQASALPDDLPEFPGLDVSASSEPAYEVGGDFYDFLGHHNAITFLIGDVSGKGTSAALYLSRAQGIVRAIDSYGPSLWELLVRLNTQIFDHLDRQAFLTLAALRVNLLSDSITFLRAGHLPMLQYKASTDDVLEHKPRGLGIGLDATSFGTHLEELTLRREENDIYLLVTDGITEAANGSGQQYGMERTAAVLRANAAGSARDVRDALLASVRDFVGDTEQFDDMTVLVVRIQ